MEEVLNTLIKKLDLQEKLIGILQYGSSLKKEDLDEFSDIDILIVIKDQYFDEQSRGSISFNKTEIEYFIETETEIYKDFLDELDTLIPINRNRFLTGKILIDTENKLEALKQRAKKMNSMPYTPMSLLDIKKNGISFYNRLNKLKRKKKYRHKDFQYYYYRCVNELIEIYSHITLTPIINDKLYNSLKDDNYRRKYFQYEIKDDFCKECFIKIIEKPNLKVLENTIDYIFKKYINATGDYRLYYYRKEI